MTHNHSPSQKQPFVILANWSYISNFTIKFISQICFASLVPGKWICIHADPDGCTGATVPCSKGLQLALKTTWQCAHLRRRKQVSFPNIYSGYEVLLMLISVRQQKEYFEDIQWKWGIADLSLRLISPSYCQINKWIQTNKHTNKTHNPGHTREFVPPPLKEHEIEAGEREVQATMLPVTWTTTFIIYINLIIHFKFAHSKFEAVYNVSNLQLSKCLINYRNKMKLYGCEFLHIFIERRRKEKKKKNHFRFQSLWGIKFKCRIQSDKGFGFKISSSLNILVLQLNRACLSVFLVN